jgi:CubicO group peptidase (beta-lactamase class C family)
LIIWSFVFELVLPSTWPFAGVAFADHLDILCYALGAAFATAFWGSWYPKAARTTDIPGSSPRQARGGTALLGALTALVLAGMAHAQEAPPAGLREVLEPIRARHKLPALAAAVVLKGRVVALDAVGVRKAGGDVAVTRDDQFHIGSCTKAMTATLIGLLVEQGKLKWEMPLAEALPDLAEAMHADFRPVTVRQLLCHRGGVRPNLPEGKTWADAVQGKTPREQRAHFAKAHLTQPPAYKPGTKYQYANAGYGILGAIAERVTDTPYEMLMRKMLFEPLGMASAGFGAMGTPGEVDQPWQHRLNDKGECQAIEPGPKSDNPDPLGPGGKVHCSLADWAKFVTEHLPTSPRSPRLLKPETLAALHESPEDGNYAPGWLVVERGWGGGRVLTHAGSNTMNYAVAWLAPLRDFAVLVATNQGNGGAERAVDEVAGALVRKFLVERR